MFRKASHFFFIPLVSAFFAFYIGSIIANQEDAVPVENLALEEYLLPSDHPLQKKLSPFFNDPQMFDEPAKLEKEGFHLFRHYLRGLMVSWHPKIKGYVFKKFINSIPLHDQLDNYTKRIRGANALAKLIKDEKLEHIVTPKKWLYPLPPNFSDPLTGATTYLLIAERIDLLGTKETREIYSSTIPKKVLKELCLVLFTLRGLDSYLGNMPFTKQHRIAFIDTHRWEENRPDFLWRVKSYMLPKRLQYAEKCYQKLQQKSMVQK